MTTHEDAAKAHDKAAVAHQEAATLLDRDPTSRAGHRAATTALHESIRANNMTRDAINQEPTSDSETIEALDHARIGNHRAANKAHRAAAEGHRAEI